MGIPTRGRLRILILNQYFYPDLASTSQLLTELAEDLARYHDVTVVAGRPSYGASDGGSRRLLERQRVGGVTVIRTWSTSRPRTNMAWRLANYGTYLASCIVGAMRAGRPDVILTMTDPPVVAAVAAAVSTIRGVPFVYVNQDVFPEVGEVLGKLRNPVLIRGLAAVNRLLRRDADRVVAIGRDMERRLIELGTPPGNIEVIPNWADGTQIRPLQAPSELRAKMGWGDRFVVMHSGNVGLSQSLETFLGAADHLRGGDVQFVIIGDGASKASLEMEAERRGLTNVRFLPYQDKSTLSDSLGAADVHVIGLAKGLAGLIVPSKLYGVMAAGKPFVAAVETGSEPALVIDEAACGVRVDPGDPEALATALQQIRVDSLEEMGARGRALFEERYDRVVATEAYRRLLERVARHE